MPGGATVAASVAAVQVERSVYLMGTVATFAVDAADRAAGVAQLERMVRVVETTETELSTWRADSVLGRLNRQPVGEAMRAPAAVCDLLERVARWHETTGGAFDAAIGSLIEAWDLRGGGRQPDDAALAAARRNAGWEHLAVDRGGPAGCAITRTADVTLDAGGFGKGEAIDRVRRTKGGGDSAWMIDFGGQVAVSGASWPVAIAHPVRRNEAALEGHTVGRIARDERRLRARPDLARRYAHRSPGRPPHRAPRVGPRNRSASASGTSGRLTPTSSRPRSTSWVRQTASPGRRRRGSRPASSWRMRRTV